MVVRMDLTAVAIIAVVCTMAQHCLALPVLSAGDDDRRVDDVDPAALGGARLSRQTSRLGAELRKAELKLIPAALLEWPTRKEYGGPEDITSERQLRELGPFVAPILYGGLGNVMFQLAALIKHSQDTKLPLVIGYVDQGKNMERKPPLDRHLVIACLITLHPYYAPTQERLCMLLPSFCFSPFNLSNASWLPLWESLVLSLSLSLSLCPLNGT
jgi:hypothetical protein